jgi:hypothetical protein
MFSIVYHTVFLVALSNKILTNILHLSHHLIGILDTMSFIGDKAEEAAEKKIFESGGYTALFKYKAVRTWQKIKDCSCCA